MRSKVADFKFWSSVTHVQLCCINSYRLWCFWILFDECCAVSSIKDRQNKGFAFCLREIRPWWVVCDVFLTYYSSGNSITFCFINLCICTVFCFNIFYVLNFANSNELFQPCLFVGLRRILLLKTHLQYEFNLFSVYGNKRNFADYTLVCVFVCVCVRMCYLCVHMYMYVCVCDIFCLKLKLWGKLNILKCLSVGHTLRIVTLVLHAGSTMDQTIVLNE
jgi:hypothetical protein